MSWNSFSLDLFKVTFYFLPWSITVKPPLEEYFLVFSNHQTSKSKFLHLNCMKKSTCVLLNPRDWSGSKQAPVRRLLGTPLWKRWRDGARARDDVFSWGAIGWTLSNLPKSHGFQAVQKQNPWGKTSRCQLFGCFLFVVIYLYIQIERSSDRKILHWQRVGFWWFLFSLYKFSFVFY